MSGLSGQAGGHVGDDVEMLRSDGDGGGDVGDAAMAAGLELGVLVDVVMMVAEAFVLNLALVTTVVRYVHTAAHHGHIEGQHDSQNM